MNPTEIEFAVRDFIARPYDAESFPFDLIKIYNTSPVTIGKLKSGLTNAARQPGDLLWKKKLFFRPAQPGDDVGAIGDALAADPLAARHKPRFILVTNGEQVHARDLHLDDTLNVEYAQLDEKSDFLLPLAGFERRTRVEEHPADIKAAKKLKKLYEAILAANPTWSTGHHTHELNLLMTRLLFCFYAEDTGIFDTPQLFTNTVTQYTSEDGSDVAPLLDRLFRIMNVEEEKRSKNTSAAESRFPYVNGSLFENTVEIPQFTRTARRQMLECGDLDWTTINPDIFGSMIQTVAQDGTRSDLGMHYTSVPNILKVLQPLFIDDLHEAYEKAKDSVPKLEALLGRLSKIRVFDPACGSGNFLIIAYKEMRRLEIEILKRIGEIAPKAPFRLSGISLQNFYGLDVVDFACEIAKLSLWIAEHQMNTLFKDVFGAARPSLPLAKISTVHCKNATREEWLSICPASSDAETYLCGNPPYKGSKWQSKEQKDDLAFVFSGVLKAHKDLDYVSAWLYKSACYVSETNNTRSALVATNSICQGLQVPLLWPLLLKQGVTISFAHTSFKWDNNASNNAFIYCIILGFAPEGDKKEKALFVGDHAVRVSNINPYLVQSRDNLIVQKRSVPLNGLPEMLFGNMPRDGGNLILNPEERLEMISAYPASATFIWPYYGSQEFIQGIERYCLWISEDSLSEANSIPPINARLRAVEKFRASSDAPSTRSAAITPYRFVQIQGWGHEALIVPAVFSEKRLYPTIGVISKDAIISNLAYAVYKAPAYLLALLSSRMHWLWTQTIAGRHGMVIGYSNTIVYNNFPVAQISDEQKQSLAGYSRLILQARTKYPGKTIEWLYNPETMPASLLEVHLENDAYLEEHIYGRKFRDDAERLEQLFALYGRIRQNSDRDGTLFAMSSKRKAR